MKNSPKNQGGVSPGLKGLFLSAHAYYFIVAFEFFYMATPFAAYFYGVYGPGLAWLADSPSWAWLNTFFLPHIVIHTSSWFVNAHNLIGGILFVAGLLLFGVGAVQVYRHKLLKRQEVVNGVYAHIRHPQYAGLIAASLGMVFIWPRFLVLLGFVTMVFIYGWLARVEEGICLKKYPGYGQFMARTGMFLPRFMSPSFSWLKWPSHRYLKAAAGFALYGMSLLAATGTAAALKNHAIEAIHAVYEDDMAYLALGNDPPAKIKRVAEIALGHEKVLKSLEAAGLGKDLKTINYVLPTGFFVSEIPMVIPPGAVTGHSWPKGHDPDLYKIIFTRAQWNASRPPTGIDIVKQAVNKYPIVEVHLDLSTGEVLKVHEPPRKAFYSGMPVPIY